jgi:hypothetical protein
MPTDTYILCRALVLFLLIVAVDFRNFLNQGTGEGGSALRYAILGLPVLGLLAARSGDDSLLIRRPVFTDRLLLAFGIYALAGSVYGRFVAGVTSSALPAAAPMLLGILYLGTLKDLTASEAKSILRDLALVGLIYVTLNALANSGHVNVLAEAGAFRNAKLFFVAMALVAAVSAGQKVRAIFVAVLALYIFHAYASGTFVFVVLVSGLTHLLTRRRAGSLQTSALIVAFLTVATVAVLNFDKSVSITDEYFKTVNKQNNNITRIGLWKAGVRELRESPFVGKWWTGDTTLSVKLPQPFHAPFHNDYLMIAANGGGIAAVAFLLWLGWTNIVTIRRCRLLVRAQALDHVRLLRTLLVAFNAWAAAALFNPLLNGLGTAACLVVLYALLMAAGDNDITRGEVGARPSATEAESR